MMRAVGRRVIGSPAFPAAVLAVVIFLIASLLSGGFASDSNLRNLTITAAVIGIAGVGQTLVIIAGGIDLSVPWLIAIGGIGLTQFSSDAGLPTWALVVLLTVSGAGVGFISGIGVTRFGVPPIVMTLAVGGMVFAVLTEIQKAGSGSAGTTPAGVIEMVGLHAGPMAFVGIIWLVIAIAMSIVLSRSGFGRRVYATGSNDAVAVLAGVRTSWIRVVTYMVSGASSVLAGVILAGFVGQTFLSMGSAYLFTSIAAVAIGGVSLVGGTGNYWGTVAGAIVLTLLTAVLPMLDLGQAQLRIVYGLVILVGVIGAGLLSRRLSARRRSASADEQPAKDDNTEQLQERSI